MYGLEQNSGRNSARKNWRLRHGKDEVAGIAWREDVVPEEQPTGGLRYERRIYDKTR